jgi:hypothetical protein
LLHNVPPDDVVIVPVSTPSSPTNKAPSLPSAKPAAASTSTTAKPSIPTAPPAAAKKPPETTKPSTAKKEAGESEKKDDKARRGTVRIGEGGPGKAPRGLLAMQQLQAQTKPKSTNGGLEMYENTSNGVIKIGNQQPKPLTAAPSVPKRNAALIQSKLEGDGEPGDAPALPRRNMDLIRRKSIDAGEAAAALVGAPTLLPGLYYFTTILSSCICYVIVRVFHDGFGDSSDENFAGLLHCVLIICCISNYRKLHCVPIISLKL